MIDIYPLCESRVMYDFRIALRAEEQAQKANRIMSRPMQRNGMNKRPTMHKKVALQATIIPYNPSPPVRTSFPDDDESKLHRIVLFLAL